MLPSSSIETSGGSLLESQSPPAVKRGTDCQAAQLETGPTIPTFRSTLPRCHIRSTHPDVGMVSLFRSTTHGATDARSPAFAAAVYPLACECRMSVAFR